MRYTSAPCRVSKFHFKKIHEDILLTNTFPWIIWWSDIAIGTPAAGYTPTWNTNVLASCRTTWIIIARRAFLAASRTSSATMSWRWIVTIAIPGLRSTSTRTPRSPRAPLTVPWALNNNQQQSKTIVEKIDW